jgi:hypothetical protein
LIAKNKHKIDEVNENKNKTCDPILKEESVLKKNDKSICTNKESIRKKVWDSDLRKCLGQHENINKNDSSKKNHKKIKKEICEKETPKINKNNVKLVKIKENSTSEKLEKIKIEKLKNIDDTKKVMVKSTILETGISNITDVKTAKDLLDILSDNINNDDMANEESVLNLASEEMNKLTKINKNNNDDEKMCDDKNGMETLKEKLPNEFVPDKDLKSKEPNEKVCYRLE